MSTRKPWRPPWIVRKRWWTPPFGRFSGITLYPFVFLRPGWSERTMRHELIHVWQVEMLGWFRFYGLYVWRWIRGVPYHEQPAEVEAYANDSDPDFLPPRLERLVRAGALALLLPVLGCVAGLPFTPADEIEECPALVVYASVSDSMLVTDSIVYNPECLTPSPGGPA